jgi:hypothetical protein
VADRQLPADEAAAAAAGQVAAALPLALEDPSSGPGAPAHLPHPHPRPLPPHELTGDPADLLPCVRLLLDGSFVRRLVTVLQYGVLLKVKATPGQGEVRAGLGRRLGGGVRVRNTVRARALKMHGSF